MAKKPTAEPPTGEPTVAELQRAVDGLKEGRDYYFEEWEKAQHRVVELEAAADSAATDLEIASENPNWKRQAQEKLRSAVPKKPPPSRT